MAALALLAPGAVSAQSAPPDLAAALASLPAEGFVAPAGPWALSLPADHGPHPETRSETWAVSIHLIDEAGATLAGQFVLTRLGVIAPRAEAASAPWALRALWRGHVALSPAGAAEERFARDAPGAAGHDGTAGELRLDDWTLNVRDDGSLSVALSAGGTALALTLTREKPALALGGQGPFRGYAAPRWRAEGTAGPAGAPRAVEGRAWVEHFWGDLPTPGGPVAWDRLTLHLDDDSDLSLTRTRRRDGLGAPSVEAVLIGADGRATPVEDATVEIARTWRGPDGEAWPVGWRIRAQELDLTAQPARDDQRRAFAEPLWIGPVAAGGRIGGRAVAGAGSLTLTGYGAP